MFIYTLCIQRYIEGMDSQTTSTIQHCLACLWTQANIEIDQMKHDWNLLNLLFFLLDFKFSVLIRSFELPRGMYLEYLTYFMRKFHTYKSSHLEVLVRTRTKLIFSYFSQLWQNYKIPKATINNNNNNFYFLQSPN